MYFLSSQKSKCKPTWIQDPRYHQEHTYIEHLSQTNWKKLTEHKKKQHFLANCKACDLRISRINPYFLYGVTRQTVTYEGVSNKLTVESFKPLNAKDVYIHPEIWHSDTEDVFKNG